MNWREIYIKCRTFLSAVVFKIITGQVLLLLAGVLLIHYKHLSYKPKGKLFIFTKIHSDA